jgi:hypothetical protein
MNGRRSFLTMAVTGVSGAIAGGGVPVPAASADGYDPDAMAAEVSAKLFADDGLVRPVPETPIVSDLAKGLDRALVLGGGGEYYVAWYCGFFHGLYELGVDLNVAEMVVGTSAGAYAGSSLTSGHFQRLRLEFDFFGHFPSLFARLAPLGSPNLSQKRAQEINFNVKDGSPASIRAIGHAALAADNRVNGSGVERVAGLLTGDSTTDWPPAKMYTTANDCYAGERLIVSQATCLRTYVIMREMGQKTTPRSGPGIEGSGAFKQNDLFKYRMDFNACIGDNGSPTPAAAAGTEHRRCQPPCSDGAPQWSRSKARSKQVLKVKPPVTSGSKGCHRNKAHQPNNPRRLTREIVEFAFSDRRRRDSRKALRGGGRDLVPRPGG